MSGLTNVIVKGGEGWARSLIIIKIAKIGERDQICFRHNILHLSQLHNVYIHLQSYCSYNYNIFETVS